MSLAFYNFILVDGNLGDAPEKVEETEHLDQHADGRPLEKDEEDSAEEADRPA